VLTTLAQHGWLGEVNPLGPQTITMRVPSGVTVRSVELLRAGQRPSFTVHEQLLQFTVPVLDDYEVAAITVM
jgi:hypothetical protein